jgi:hypothetical protein
MKGLMYESFLSTDIFQQEDTFHATYVTLIDSAKQSSRYLVLGSSDS